MKFGIVMALFFCAQKLNTFRTDLINTTTSKLLFQTKNLFFHCSC